MRASELFRMPLIRFIVLARQSHRYDVDEERIRAWNAYLWFIPWQINKCSASDSFVLVNSVFAFVHRFRMDVSSCLSIDGLRFHSSIFHEPKRMRDISQLDVDECPLDNDERSRRISLQDNRSKCLFSTKDDVFLSSMCQNNGLFLIRKRQSHQSAETNSTISLFFYSISLRGTEISMELGRENHEQKEFLPNSVIRVNWFGNDQKKNSNTFLYRSVNDIWNNPRHLLRVAPERRRTRSMTNRDAPVPVKWVPVGLGTKSDWVQVRLGIQSRLFRFMTRAVSLTILKCY